MRYAVRIVRPAGYAHAETFREVAESLYYGLAELGRDVVLATTADTDDRLQIVLGANLLPYTDEPLPTDAVLYNLEHARDDSPWFSGPLRHLYHTHRVWDWSPTNTALLARMGFPRVTHVPLGHTPHLERIAGQAEDIDVLFYGSLTPRRHAILSAIRSRGLRLETVFACYGAARDALIARSKLVVIIHADARNLFEAVRAAYLLSNGRAVVAEASTFEDDAPWLGGVAFATAADIPSACAYLVIHADKRHALARAGKAMMQARPIAQVLAGVLPSIEGAAP